MRAPTILAALTLATGAAGCDDPAAGARQACFDVEVARAGRCPERPFDEEAARSGCSNVVEIRDRTSLYDECIPALEALPCDVEGPVPEACVGQLVTR